MQSTIDDNPKKPYTETLDLLVQSLRKLNHSLAPELQIDSFTHNKLITACEAIPAFQIACRKPAPTVTGLISDLRAAAASYDRLHPINKSETMFTDRKYYSGRDLYRNSDRQANRQIDRQANRQIDRQDNYYQSDR